MLTSEEEKKSSENAFGVPELLCLLFGSGLSVGDNRSRTALVKDFGSLEHVVQIDCLFRDVWNIPTMEKVIKERFNGKYPVRKSIQTNFAHTGGENGLQFQLDGIAYAGE